MKYVLLLLLFTVVQCEYYQGVKRDLQKLTDEQLEALFKEALKENSEKSDYQKNLNHHPKRKITIQRENFSVRDNENKKEEIYDELKDSNNINNFKSRDIKNTEKNEMIKNEKGNLKKSVNINIFIGNEKEGTNNGNLHSNWQSKGVAVKTVVSKQHPDSSYPGNLNGASQQHPEGITGSSYTNTDSGLHSGVSNPIIAPPPLTRDEERYFNNDEFINAPQEEEKIVKSNHNKLLKMKSNGIDRSEINQIKNFKKENFDVENLDNEEKLDIFAQLLDRSYGSDDYIKKELQNLNGNVIRTLLTKEMDNKQQEDTNSKILTRPIRPMDKETLNTLLYDRMKAKNAGNTKTSENVKDETHIEKIEKPDNTGHGKGGKNILEHGKEAVKSGFKNLKSEMKSFTHKFMENIFHRKKKPRKEDFEENLKKFERKIDSEANLIREAIEAEEYYPGVKRDLRELSNDELVALFKETLKENQEKSD